MTVFRCKSMLKLLCAAGLVAATAGCAGYRFGNQTLYRSDIRTVHVPVFESDGFRRNLGEQLTEAVVKEIERTSSFKVVSASTADSVLTGRIRPMTKRVTARSAGGQPRDVEIGLGVEINWSDRRGNLIGQAGTYPVAPVLIEAVQSAHAVPEAGQSIATARQEAVTRLARQIVSHMEMPW